MKQIQVLSYCDGLAHHEPVPSTVERVVSVDGRKAVLLDLCDQCDKLFADLFALMEHGTEVETKTKTKTVKPHQASTKCPECGAVSINRNSLGQHTRSQHKKGLKDYPPEAWAG